MLRVGLLSAAHVHATGYARCLSESHQAEFVGVWDEDDGRAGAIAERFGGRVFTDLGAFLAECDAVAIASENLRHADHIEAAARSGLAILCEKPVVASREHAAKVRAVLDETGVAFMTAFPCPFSPAFLRLRETVASGAIGRVLAVNATNRGRCPFGWFVQPELSGGGAMIDHVVHVADLLWRLLGEAPHRVAAQTGSNVYGQAWEDTAHVTLGYPSGVFATIDSSWSRPQTYRTWGDVTLKVVGEKGLIEADLFDQGLGLTTDTLRRVGTGSDLDQLMVREFLDSLEQGRPPLVTAEDGLRASEVALAAYENVASPQTGALA